MDGTVLSLDPLRVAAVVPCRRVKFIKGVSLEDPEPSETIMRPGGEYINAPSVYPSHFSEIRVKP